MSEAHVSKPLTAVIIDDDPSHLELIRESLFFSGDPTCPLRVQSYSSADEALIDLPPSGNVVILCDNQLGGASGLDWLPDFVRADVGPVIIMTAQGDEKTAAEAFHRGAADYLDKASIFEKPDDFWRTIREAMRRFKLDHTNRDRAKDLKICNHQLEERNRQLNEMTETAHQFVDDVAHEFRTPLTVIREFGSILADGIGGELTDEQRDFVNHIDTAARDLSQMVDDFLDSSKLKTNTLRVDRKPVDVAEVFDHIRPMLEARAKAKSIRVVCELEDGLPRVFCDPEKAGRVIINLVVNAIKFSSIEGLVEVAAEATGNGEVSIRVRDYGAGIAEDALPRLGERFTQAGNAKSESGKGFGLGLSIAKDLVTLNFGRMSIRSKLGEGSTFGFTLPVADPEQVLHRYARQQADTDPSQQVAVMRIDSIHPKATAETIRAPLAANCRSMDLLIAAPDGRTVFALGCTDTPDKWIDRLGRVWDESRHDNKSSVPLNVQWLGSWAAGALEEAALPQILKTFISLKQCA